MDHQFRSVAFGGFHKQDVLNFVENTAKDHAQQLQELQQKLEEQGRQLESALNERDSLRAQTEQTGEELEQLRARTEELTGRLERAESDRADLSARLDEMTEKAAGLEPDALAYRELKERTAGVELEAHRRAQAVEDRAADRAEQVRAGAAAWLKELGQEYDRLCTQTETTAAYARVQLQQAENALDQLGARLGGQAAALEPLKRLLDGQNGTAGAAEE